MKKLVNKKLAKKILSEKRVEFPSAIYTHDLDLENEEIVFICSPTDGKARHEERYPIADFPEFEIPKESSDVRTEEEPEIMNLPFEVQVMTPGEITEQIYWAIEDTKRNFLTIARGLYLIKEIIERESQIAIPLGRNVNNEIAYCKNIYEYGKKVFGLTKSTVSDFINIADRFLEYEDNKPCNWLRFEYDGYSSSQLQALLPIKDDNWIQTHCKPSMTVREIKALSKQWKEGAETFENPSMKTEEEYEETVQQNNKQDFKQNENDSVQNDKTIKTLKEYRFNSFEGYNKELDKMDEKISNLLKSGKSLVISIKEV